MNRRFTTLAILAVPVVLAGFVLGRSLAQKKPARSAPPAVSGSHAYLAGGCFWCLETAYEGVPGVKAAISGYTGGPEKNPTYDQVSSHKTGHLEAVDVVYDPAKISYQRVLDIFWHNIDPTQADGQFCDRGHQYTSAIFTLDSTQARIARQSKRAIELSGVLRGKPIVTAILPASTFWVAEDYHQDFWRKDPLRYKTYRAGCGRDRRLDQLWGKDARRGSVTH